MFGAVFFLSLSMVLEDTSYAILADRGLGEQSFLLGFSCFAFGAFLSGLFFALFGKVRLWPLLKKYFVFFILLEGLTSLGNFSSQRAIDVAPSVSFVSAIETFVPVFIMIFCLLILFFIKYIYKKQADILKRIYTEQLSGLWFKVLATAIMAVGVYIMS
jgi:hypothetical protein